MSSNRHALTLLALLVLLAFAWPMAAYVRYASSPVPAKPEAVPAVQLRPDPADPPEVSIGERLFRETRFAQFFSTHAGSVNAPLERGDPSLGRTMTASGSPLPRVFADQSMSCRACHMVEEHAASVKGSRSYTDFGRQSPIPVRDDGFMASVRNSPTAVDASLPRATTLLHYDGEFASAEDLVRETLLGRNFGWLPSERGLALHHVARLIRDDDGSGALARAFGGSYRDVLGGALSVPERLRIPERYRINVALASDETIVNAVSVLVAEYLRSLEFDRDERGRFDGSAYDRFLMKNGLPQAPAPGEPDSMYARRLRAAVERLEQPRFVGVTEGRLRLHDHPFVSGPRSCAGSACSWRTRPVRGRRARASATARAVIRRLTSPISASTTPARARASTRRSMGPDPSVASPSRTSRRATPATMRGSRRPRIIPARSGHSARPRLGCDRGTQTSGSGT